MNWSRIKVFRALRKLHLEANSEIRVMKSGMDSFLVCLRDLNFMASETLGFEKRFHFGDKLAEIEDIIRDLV